MTKHVIGYEQIKMEFAPPKNRRDISRPLKLVGFEGAWPCQYD
jgi:hypothetical protein